jgi:hypothetical protein
MKITIYSWSIKRYWQADSVHGARNLALSCQIKQEMNDLRWPLTFRSRGREVGSRLPTSPEDEV